jgi:hypothetical protein
VPHLEEVVLFERFSSVFDGFFFSGSGLMSQSTRKFMQSNLNVSHCPSDSSSQGLSTTQFQWAGVQVGLTNYKGVMGENAVYLPSQEESYKIGTCAGLFFRTNYQRDVVGTQLFVVSPAIGGDVWRVGICSNINVS